MKSNRPTWMLLAMFLTIAAVVASGCSANGNGVVEQPATETPAEDGQSAAEEPAEQPGTEQPGTEQPAPEQPAQEEPAAEPETPPALSVMTGATVQIETTIEGMAEQVEVTEYEIEPYGIQYHLRSIMGEPAVEQGQVVHRTQMGDEVATVAVEVWSDTTLDAALQKAADQYAADGFEGDEARDASTETLTGKVASFQGDGYFVGYHVYAIGDDAVVVHRNYPFEAADGMAAMLNEMLTSLRG